MIKATIVLLAAHLVIPRLNRRSAAERHALWTAAIAIAAALPVLTWLLPSWEPAWAQRAADTWPAAFESSSPAFSAGDIVVRATGIDSGRWTIVSIAPTLWVAVSILLLLRLAMQALQLTRLTSSGIPSGSRLPAIGRTVADALSLPPPRVTCSERVSIPLAWGVRRARVLLPPASHAWPDERVWAVCAHELAHISRGDWIVHLLAEIACRIYWFNPLLWLARNRLSRESERAADDVVIGLGASGADYASHLIEILRGARPDLNPTPAVGMVRLRTTRFGEAGRESGFERRIAALVNALVNRTRLSRNWAMAILAGACILAAPLATLNARGRSTIEIRTSNLPPIVDSAVRELASDGSDPVREIRVVNRAATQDVAPSVCRIHHPAPARTMRDEEASKGSLWRRRGSTRTATSTLRGSFEASGSDSTRTRSSLYVSGVFAPAFATVSRRRWMSRSRSGSRCATSRSTRRSPMTWCHSSVRVSHRRRR